MDNSAIINNILVQKANAEAIIVNCDKLLKDLNPSRPKKKAGLTDEQIARLTAKGLRTIQKQIDSRR